MVIYIYQCETEGCPNEGVDLERQYPIGQNPEFIACPECGNPAKRRIGKVRVVYNGEGWGGHPEE